MTKNVVEYFSTTNKICQTKLAKENFAEGNCFKFTQTHLLVAKFAKETFACVTQVIGLLKVMSQVNNGSLLTKFTNRDFFYLYLVQRGIISCPLASWLGWLVGNNKN